MNYSPPKALILFFLGLIVVGALLLSLPVSRSSVGFSFITSLFTSVSAVCVTGLSIVNVGEYYSTFGQIVILILVQLGGIGYMFVSTFVALLFGKMALKDRRIMQDIFDLSSFSSLKKLLSKAAFFVLVIEFTGAVVLTFIFLHSFSFLKSIYLGIFYSIAAFCNAGFGFFRDSLAGFANDPALLYVISVLVLIGGLGFFVIVDIYDTYREKHLHLLVHTKVVLSMLVAITFFAFILFLFSDTLRGHGILYSINNAFFQAVSARTAGFYSVPVNLFSKFTNVVLLFLMSAGASPGSTAGGVKVTTLVLTFIFVKSVLKGDDDFVLFKRRIPGDLVKKALAVFIMFFASIAVFSVILVLFESCLNPLAIIFEVVSAFATVGLSLGITADLSVEGKVLIIIAMIAGRIGILTLSILVLNPVAKKKSIKYPETRILVG
jgi:trk system potassium uptake protein TrkH